MKFNDNILLNKISNITNNKRKDDNDDIALLNKILENISNISSKARKIDLDKINNALKRLDEDVIPIEYKLKQDRISDSNISIKTYDNFKTIYIIKDIQDGNKQKLIEIDTRKIEDFTDDLKKIKENDYKSFVTLYNYLTTKNKKLIKMIKIEIKLGENIVRDQVDDILKGYEIKQRRKPRWNLKTN